MDARTILSQEVLASHDSNLVYHQLLTSPPLLFAKIARELLAAGAIAAWHQSADSSARVLASACDVANNHTDALPKLMKEISLADKSSFEHFDRIAYLADALLLTCQQSNRNFYDMPTKRVNSDESSNKLRKMLGKFAEHFWRDMPDQFLLHVASHLTQPYRIQRLARWVNYRWPQNNEDDGSIFASSYFETDCKHLILKTLFILDVSWIDKAGINNILETQGSKIPALKKLTAKQREQLFLSLQWTISILNLKSAKLEDQQAVNFLPAANDDAIYKNLSGINLYRIDLSEADLKGANLYSASLNRATFRHAYLSYANLTNAHFMYTGGVTDDLPPSGADFHGANMTGAIFQGARIEGLNFNYAILRDADFRFATVCGDSDLYTMRLAEAKDITGISFSNADFMRSNIFFGTNINHIDTSSCTVQASYFETSMTLESLFTATNPQQLLQTTFQSDPPSFYLMIKLYLSAKTYHEAIHQILTTMLTDDPLYGAKLLNRQLAEMKRYEEVRLANLREGLGEVLQSGGLDLASILSLRLTSKSVRETVKKYLLDQPMLLLDYCLDFASTTKLNEVAVFCESIDVLNDWLSPDQTEDRGYARLFALAMKSRLGDNIDFADTINQEIQACKNRQLSITNFHRLAYLIETVCTDHQVPLPNDYFLKIDGNAWSVLDIIVSNLKNPVRIFRLTEFINDIELKNMQNIAPAIPSIMQNKIEHYIPEHALSELPAIAVLTLLFTDVNWEGHKELESYLNSLRSDLRERYGKELCDILYNSLWITRECQRGSLTSESNPYFKNLIGLVSHTGYIWYKQNTGANLKGAYISGGMDGKRWRYEYDNAWLKNATLVKHQNDNRRHFMGESFKGTNLCGATIIDANMEGADFTYADLRHVTFTNTCTKNAKFDKANLTKMQVIDVPQPIVAENDHIPERKLLVAEQSFSPAATLHAQLQEIDAVLPTASPEIATTSARKPLEKVSSFFARLFHKKSEDKNSDVRHVKRFR